MQLDALCRKSPGRYLNATSKRFSSLASNGSGIGRRSIKRTIATTVHDQFDVINSDDA
jgi:hypothetical protein